VRFFNEQRGFGLISRDKGGDVSVHFFTVQGTGFSAMPDGVGVEFAFLGRLGDAAKGLPGR
jgi:CspA family cold shock protein